MCYNVFTLKVELWNLKLISLYSWFFAPDSNYAAKVQLFFYMHKSFYKKSFFFLINIHNCLIIKTSPISTIKSILTIFDFQYSTLDFQHSTFNIRLSTFDFQHSTFNSRLSTLDFQLSTFNFQLSIPYLYLVIS